MSADNTSRRIESVEAIEKNIASALEAAGLAASELAKENCSQYTLASHTTSFLTLVQNVETGLSKQIAYLGQVSSSNVAANTSRISELEFSHMRRSTEEAQQSLERRLAASATNLNAVGAEEDIATTTVTAGASGAGGSSLSTAAAADGQGTMDTAMDTS